MASDIKTTTPPNILKSKVGSGGISPLLLDRAERLVEKSDLGFGEYIEEQIGKLDNFVDTLKGQSQLSDDEQLDLIAPVMTLKAHGGMFGYNIVTNIAHDVLTLLEEVHNVNEDLCEILSVFQKTLRIIVDKGLKGDGGAIGAKLAQEISAACARYSEKY